MAGRAVTMRFVPSRPDFRAKVIGGTESAEYQAMELCGPDDVLVMDAMGWANPSAAGGIKLLRLKQRKAAGVVTDASVRDMEALRAYGIGVFAAGETNMTMPSHMLPCDVKVPVQCGGVLVLPGDYVSADDGGVVVVPQQLIEEVVAHAREHEALEAVVEQQLSVEDVSLASTTRLMRRLASYTGASRGVNVHADAARAKPKRRPASVYQRSSRMPASASAAAADSSVNL